MQEPLQELLPQENRQKIINLLLRATRDERLLAVGFCNQELKLLYQTPAFPADISCRAAMDDTRKTLDLITLPHGPVHVAANAIELDGKKLGALVLLHDMSYMVRRSADTRNYVIFLFIVLGVVVSLINVFVAHLIGPGGCCWMLPGSASGKNRIPESGENRNVRKPVITGRNCRSGAFYIT
jgi:hypothetical protein